MVKFLHVFVLGMLLAGCSSMPSGSTRIFKPTVPTVVIGRVLELRPRGAWIDLDNGFISYDSVVVKLSSPSEASGKSVYLQYQGDSIINSLKIRLGQIVTFTLPTVPDNGCCEPYLEGISDFKIVDDR